LRGAKLASIQTILRKTRTVLVHTRILVGERGGGHALRGGGSRVGLGWWGVVVVEGRG
jgi:hypothetical protein